MQFLGIDIGSSSINASVIDGETGVCLVSASHPKVDLQINSPLPGWAEQNPEIWWENIKEALKLLHKSANFDKVKIGGIGIGFYKNTDDAFHGLKILDRIEPKKQSEILKQSYPNWLQLLNKYL